MCRIVFLALFKVHVFTLKIENMKLLTHDHDDASPVGGPGLPPAGDRVGGHNLGPGGEGGGHQHGQGQL